MMRWLWLAIMVFIVVPALIIAACAAPTVTQTVTVTTTTSPITTPTTTTPSLPTKADPASIARGGAIYDKWWEVVEGAIEPIEDHPLWSLQSTNTRSGSDTWRCKECHGWDYRGKDGAYASGSHYTGFPGVYNAGTTNTKAQLLEILKGNNDFQCDFTFLGDDALLDLVNFLSEGLIYQPLYIDYATKKVIGAHLEYGRELFLGSCHMHCHGMYGQRMNFGSPEEPEYVGTLANSNPWEVLHKIRFGNPGTPMPSAVANGWSIQDVVDVLGYAQTLPIE